MSSNGHPNSGGENGHPNSGQVSAPAPNSTANTAPRRRTARDYQFGTRIGEGSYSTVYLAVDLYNKKTYAVKVLSKKHIVQEGKIKYVNIEKTTLHRLGVQHPGIVQLYYTFQDELSLFFVLDFAEYGELLSIISKFGSLLESVLKFYMLQILDAVKFIHLKGVIHRDLKPENILVGYDFNLKITDFGAAKLLGDDNDTPGEKITYDSVNEDSQNGRLERKGSFVGTAEYVPPELLKHNLCGFETDIWAIACILFQFFNGVPPFKGATEYLTFEKIINIDYSYKEQAPPMVKEIIEKILVLEPLQRPTIPEIQGMAWFQGVPWNNRDYIWHRKVPRFEPYSQGSAVVTNPPQLKTGANRNFNKSNSNYQLHSQILKFDNLVPTFGNKSLYVPATRLKKGIPPAGVHLSPSPNLGPPQNVAPHLRQEPGNSPKEQHFKIPSSPVHAQHRQKPTPAAFRQMAFDPHQGISQGPHKVPSSPQNRHVAPLSQQSNSYIAAQQASAALALVDKSLAETKISGSPRSPERKNLRNNTAFASLQKPSVTKVSTPAVKRPETAQSQAPSRPAQQKQPVTGSAPVKSIRKEPVTITLKEISSFLDSDEKIIKLDCVLKLMLSNKLIDRKPGSLDDEVIEKLIDRHQTILDARMVPVIACISNKAKVFLIDDKLEVMMVDLTANKGGDYLMYDYEFESLIVEDEQSHTKKNGEEVFGYLILELIKEGGDLIFLKRFDEKDKVKYSNSIKVVGSKGETTKIGTNFGWIDCLIWAKEMVDKELKAKRVQSTKPSSQQRQKSPPKRQTSSSKPSRSSSSSKAPSSSKAKPTAKASGRYDDRDASDSKSPGNNFAYAAAAAAHR